jgi:hypothetical protein
VVKSRAVKLGKREINAFVILKLNVTGKRQLILSVLYLLLIPIPHLPLQPDASSPHCQYSAIWRENFRSHLQSHSNKLLSPSAVLTPSVDLETTWRRGLDSSGSWQGHVAGSYEHGKFMHADVTGTNMSHSCKPIQMYSVHAILSYLFKIYFNRILPSMIRSSKWSLSVRFPCQTLVHAILSYFFKFHFNRILPSMFRSSKWSLSVRFPCQTLVHAILSYFFKIHFNKILPSIFRSSKWSLSVRFPCQTLHASLFSPHPSHASTIASF